MWKVFDMAFNGSDIWKLKFSSIWLDCVLVWAVSIKFSLMLKVLIDWFGIGWIDWFGQVWIDFVWYDFDLVFILWILALCNVVLGKQL